MPAASTAFWQECERYHDLAERFERNTEVTHPHAVTGRRDGCACRCTWCASKVTYYEYRGERL